jgi:hypothetical protein
MTPIATNLKTVENYGVLGGSGAIANTGFTVINGNLGLSPGSSVTGFPPGIVTGRQDVDNPAAVQAATDLSNAITYFSTLTPTGGLPSELAGVTLGPGVYNNASAVDLSVGGTFTLNAGGNPAAQFILIVGSALTINNGASVVLAGGALAENVVWVLGTSATVGTGVAMVGNILALASITLNGTAGATLIGRAAAHVSVTFSGAVVVTTPSVPLTGSYNVITSRGSHAQFTKILVNSFSASFANGTIAALKLNAGDFGHGHRIRGCMCSGGESAGVPLGLYVEFMAQDDPDNPMPGSDVLVFATSPNNVPFKASVITWEAGS